jgi:hypothetical protein
MQLKLEPLRSVAAGIALLSAIIAFMAGFWLGYWLGINEVVRQYAPIRIEKPAGSLAPPTFAQDEQTVWVMAVYKDGDLVKTVTFHSEGACRAACDRERGAGVTCLCGPRRIYRPKRWSHAGFTLVQSKGGFNPLAKYCDIPDVPRGARRLAYVRDLSEFEREAFFAMSDAAQDAFWERLSKRAGCRF